LSKKLRKTKSGEKTKNGTNELTSAKRQKKKLKKENQADRQKQKKE